MKISNKKLIIGICVISFIFLTSFTSKVRRKKGDIRIYPSLNFKMNSNETEGVFYIGLANIIGPFTIPIYLLDRVSSFIYDTILFPIDAFRYYKLNNNKIIKYYENNSNDIQIKGKKLEYTLKNGKYIGGYYEYFKNGNIKEFSNWKNGKLDGIKKTYYLSGGLKTDELWKDNQLISLIYYDSNNKIIVKISNNMSLNIFLKEEYEYSNNITIVQVLKFDYPIDFDINKINKSENGVWIKTQNFKNNKLIYEVMYICDEDQRIEFKEVNYSENGEIISQCIFNEEQIKNIYKK